MTDEDVRMTGADVDLHSGGEFGVQRAGDRDQLIARHGQEAFVAAERDRVQFGDDDDVFFRLILVLQGNAGVLWRMRDVRNGRRAFRLRDLIILVAPLSRPQGCGRIRPCTVELGYQLVDLGRGPGAFLASG